MLGIREDCARSNVKKDFNYVLEQVIEDAASYVSDCYRSRYHCACWCNFLGEAIMRCYLQRYEEVHQEAAGTVKHASNEE